MSTIQEMQRLKELGHNKSQTARLLGLSRETVIKLWDASPEDYNESGEAPQWVKKVNWGYLEKQLKTVPRKILYEEQKEFIELPSYQAFCKYLRKHKAVTTPAHISLKQERTPGKSIEVDYSGDSPPEIINPATGGICGTELFVGSLSYSGYFYAEFSQTQQLEDFIRSHCNMFAYFGGVTQSIVPDNCKTAVKKTHRYDPAINNSTYLDMCRYYEIVVDPPGPLLAPIAFASCVLLGPGIQGLFLEHRGLANLPLCMDLPSVGFLPEVSRDNPQVLGGLFGIKPPFFHIPGDHSILCTIVKIKL